LPDYRFEGITLTGRPVQGIITADNFSEAKKKIKLLAEQRKIKVTKIQKRRTFIYKVQRDSEKPITGEQKAFTKEEVRQALEKLGYKVVSIQPKVLDFKFKPPETEIITFVRVSSDMLREKLPYNEVLQLLINDVQHPTLKEALREINNDLRQGKDSEEAFIKQERVLGKFTARMLGLASKSGNMADIYESTAKFLERNAEFKKNLKSALIMPIFTLIALIGAVIFYVAYIFPETAELFLKLGVELPPMTAATLKLSYFLIDNMTFILLVTAVIVFAFILFSANSKGAIFYGISI
jgi:type IV pilus assembly protein PilC